MNDALAFSTGLGVTLHILEGTYSDGMALTSISYTIGVDAGEAIVNGAITSSNSSPGTLTVNKPLVTGTLTFTAANSSLLDNISVNAGTFKIQSNANAAGVGVISVGNGGTLQVDNVNVTNQMSLATGSKLMGTGANAQVSDNSNLITIANGASVTFSTGASSTDVFTMLYPQVEVQKRFPRSAVGTAILNR